MHGMLDKIVSKLDKAVADGQSEWDGKVKAKADKLKAAQDAHTAAKQQHTKNKGTLTSAEVQQLTAKNAVAPAVSASETDVKGKAETEKVAEAVHEDMKNARKTGIAQLHTGQFDERLLVHKIRNTLCSLQQKLDRCKGLKPECVFKSWAWLTLELQLLSLKERLQELGMVDGG